MRQGIARECDANMRHVSSSQYNESGFSKVDRWKDDNGISISLDASLHEELSTAFPT
jgi:hypothetical protein